MATVVTGNYPTTGEPFTALVRVRGSRATLLAIANGTKDAADNITDYMLTEGCDADDVLGADWRERVVVAD